MVDYRVERKTQLDHGLRRAGCPSLCINHMAVGVLSGAGVSPAVEHTHVPIQKARLHLAEVFPPIKVAEWLLNVEVHNCRSAPCSGASFASFRLFTALQQMEGLQKYIKEQMLAAISSLVKHLFV